VKITLKVDVSVRGKMTEAGATVDVGDLAGQSLIDDGRASKFEEVKTIKKIKKPKVED